MEFCKAFKEITNGASTSMYSKIITIFSLILLLASCTTPRGPATIVYTYSQHPNTANVQTQLTEAAVSVSNSLAELAAIEKYNNPRSKLPPPPNPASIGMNELSSVDWSGPVEPLIQKIATASGYKFRALGRSPAIPVIVSISSTNTPLADILRDASYQVENQADVLIYPSRRVIELRYRNG